MVEETFGSLGMPNLAGSAAHDTVKENGYVSGSEGSKA